MATDETVADVLARVRSMGGRVTSQRRRLLEVLFSSSAHRSAEDIADEVQRLSPEVHISTIYRNLDELERLGVVVHSHFGHGPATYHLAGRAHTHFVCERCGVTYEAPGEILEAVAATARRDFGFELNPYHFAIPGRCRVCQAVPSSR